MQNKASQITIIALIPLLMGFTLGCAHNPINTYVDPKLKPYLDKYREYMDEAGYDNHLPSLELSFSEYTVPHGKRSTAGVCITKREEGYISRTIYISKRHYDYFNPNDDEYDLGVESLVFHELAHCIHDADHYDNFTLKWIKTKKYSLELELIIILREKLCVLILWLAHLVVILIQKIGNVMNNIMICIWIN